MRPRTTDVVRIEFERGGNPPRGVVFADGQAAFEFYGWLELVAALEHARASAAGAPAVAPPSAQAG